MCAPLSSILIPHIQCAELEERGARNRLEEDMDRHRGNAFQARMSSNKPKIHQVANQPSVALQTDGLNTLRDATYGISSAESITVCADARVGKSLSQKLGGISRAFAADRTMDGTSCSFLSLSFSCLHLSVYRSDPGVP